MKAGYATSEFYLALGSQVIAVLVLLGYLSPDDATGATDSWREAVKGGAALIGSALTAWKYIEARARVKAANAEK